VTAVAVVGSSGRVGAAVVDHLSNEFDIRAIHRVAGESTSELADRAAAGVALIVNAAGVAHVERVDALAIERLRLGNVELPSELARAAYETGASLLHISSTKAKDPLDSPYAQSKRDGEVVLEREHADRFARKGLSIVVVRPPALLIPPLDSGKVRRLRMLRRLPVGLIPSIRLPVLTEGTLVRTIQSCLLEVAAGCAPKGYSLREFDRAELGTLRDVAAAFRGIS
jgi:nucleoside-diphosphate-sugar epimerase